MRDEIDTVLKEVLSELRGIRQDLDVIMSEGTVPEGIGLDALLKNAPTGE